MLRTYKRNRNFCIFYDIENKIIARYPTNSNLKVTGSDNSLYFGLVNDPVAVGIMKAILEISNIYDMQDKEFNMNCCGEIAHVKLNINHEGQLQVKIVENGMMSRLTTNYAYTTLQEIDFTKMLFVIDFLNKEIRFSKPW